MAVAASRIALASVSDLKQVWGKPVAQLEMDDRIQTVINKLSARAEDWCGRRFTFSLYSDTGGDYPAETVDAPRHAELLIRQYPVSKINSVTINAAGDPSGQIVVDPSDYIYYPEEGRLWYPKGWWQGATVFGWHRAVKLDYYAGFTNPYGLTSAQRAVPVGTSPYALPEGLSQAVIEWAIVILEGRRKDAKVDGSEVKLAVPDSIAYALQPYKRSDF